MIKAQQLWFAILDSQVETGTPYMLVRLVLRFSRVTYLLEDEWVGSLPA